MSAPGHNCEHCGAMDWMVMADDKWHCAVCGAAPDGTLSPGSETTGTPLSEAAHRGVLTELQALQTAEHQRRIKVMRHVTKGLSMPVRIAIARTLLLDNAKMPNAQWNALAKRVAEERRKLLPADSQPGGPT